MISDAFHFSHPSRNCILVLRKLQCHLLIFNIEQPIIFKLWLKSNSMVPVFSGTPYQSLRNLLRHCDVRKLIDNFDLGTEIQRAIKRSIFSVGVKRVSRITSLPSSWKNLGTEYCKIHSVVIGAKNCEDDIRRFSIISWLNFFGSIWKRCPSVELG